ncbi:MAG: hypothetical protein Q8K66_13095 [Sediminibacterium sp.]|nr:hypothetical protein [Sediminibacterium sp.]MDP3128829.1 hypothetical protein [Sediminibacterium sp.]
MALDKDTLGTALYNRATIYNETNIAPADLEANRLAFWKDIADEIINHIKTSGTVPALGLVSPSGVVTGSASIV